MKKMIFLTLAFFCSRISFAQDTLSLYKDSIPNSKPVPDQERSSTNPSNNMLIVNHISRPRIVVFTPSPDKANGTAVIIFPGGGYSMVAAGHEGYDVARKFTGIGVTAFVVKYRLPDTATMINREIGPLQDAQRAIQLVREDAAKWQLDPHRIGILGFSAGGHLASSLGTHYTKPLISNPAKTSLRPDFMVLVYPVISFSDSTGHIGSRNNLLGLEPSAEKITEYSNELQVTPQTAPAFLVHAKDDNTVTVRNSIDFYEALKKNHVPAEIYLYETGGHGFGLNNKTSDVQWFDLVSQWMQKSGWLKK